MAVPQSLAYAEWRLSGGAANSDPAASLGGIMSSTRILHQSGTGITNITGVTIDDGLGLPTGAGTLSFTASGQTITWAAAGESAGAAVAITEDGNYALQSSGGGWLLIAVVNASLPGTNQSDTITIANLANKLWDNIEKQESLDGDAEYRCCYLVNTHPTETALAAKAWIGLDPTGADSWEIGLDPAGIGDGSTTGVATTVADESTAPAGVTFSTPTSSATALSMGHLTTNDAHALWVKRIVPVNTTVATPTDIAELRFQVSV